METFFGFITFVSWGLLLLMAFKLIFFVYFSRIHFRSGKNAIETYQYNICYQPDVSIIVPAYNEELVLENCVKSLLKLDYPSFEVIVVDDGSSDATATIGKKLEAEYPQVRCLLKSNGGKANALNYGIEHASGEIIVCIDADSIFDSKALFHLTLPFADPNVGAVGGNVKVANRSKVLNIHQATEYIVGLNIQRRAFAQLDCMQVISGAIGAFKKDVLLEIGGYSTDTIVEDMDITVSIAKAGYKVRFNAYAIAYTESPESITDFIKQRYRWTIGGFKVLKKHKDMLFNGNYGMMGMVGLPYFLIFPWIDVTVSLLFILIILKVLVTGNYLAFILFFSGMLVVQSLLMYYALYMDKERKHLMLFVAIESLWYIHLLNFITLKAAINYFSGKEVTWNKLVRLGKNLAPVELIVNKKSVTTGLLLFILSFKDVYAAAIGAILGAYVIDNYGIGVFTSVSLVMVLSSVSLFWLWHLLQKTKIIHPQA